VAVHRRGHLGLDQCAPLAVPTAGGSRSSSPSRSWPACRRCTWAVALAIGALFLQKAPFLVAGLLIGSGFSGMQVADRVLMYRLSPPERLGEFYGLYGLVGKGSQVIGGMVYGLTLYLFFDSLGTGAYQLGILTLLITMLIGMWLVRGVPEKREG
jgi:MFS transporter, UMF1 family